MRNPKGAGKTGKRTGIRAAASSSVKSLSPLGSDLSFYLSTPPTRLKSRCCMTRCTKLPRPEKRPLSLQERGFLFILGRKRGTASSSAGEVMGLDGISVTASLAGNLVKSFRG